MNDEFDVLVWSKEVEINRIASQMGSDELCFGSDKHRSTIWPG